MGLCGGLLMLAVSGAAGAAEESGEVTVLLREEYNDNILLTTVPHNPVWGTTASSVFAFTHREERLQMKATGLAEYTYYAGENGLNTTDYNLTLSPAYTTGRSTWKLDAQAQQDLTLGGELQETGLILTRNRRRLWSASPSLSWSFTERALLRWQYQYQHVRYPGGGAGLFDYNVQAVAMTGVFSATETDTVTGELFYTDYETSAVSFRSQNYGVRVGMTHHYTELVTGSLSGGADQTRSDLGHGTTDRQWGGLMKGTVERRSERTRLTAGLSQEIYPSGAGYLVQTDRLSGQARGNLFLSLSAFVLADAYWSTALKTGVTNPHSRYHTVKVGASWAWDEHWSVEASYRLQRQSAPTAVTSNTVSCAVTYNRKAVLSSP